MQMLLQLKYCQGEMCNFHEPDLITFWLSLSSTELDRSSPLSSPFCSSSAGDFLAFKWSISTGLPSNSVSSELLEKSIGASVSSSNIPNDTKTEYSLLSECLHPPWERESEVFTGRALAANWLIRVFTSGGLRRALPALTSCSGQRGAPASQHGTCDNMQMWPTSPCHPDCHHGYSQLGWEHQQVWACRDFSGHCYHSMAGNRNYMNGYLLLMQFEKLDMSSFISFLQGWTNKQRLG